MPNMKALVMLGVENNCIYLIFSGYHTPNEGVLAAAEADNAYRQDDNCVQSAHYAAG